MPGRRQSITATPRRTIGLALALVVGMALISVPARASTESELQAKKAQLEALEAELQRVTLDWQETEARLARAQDAAAAARVEILRLHGELASIQQSLNDRVAAAYMSGGAFSMGALLTSDSIQAAADRLQYTMSVVQGDADLATDVAATTEELRWEEDQLRAAVRDEAAAAADLETQRAVLAEKIAQLDDAIAELKADLAAEEEAQLGLTGVVIRSGAIQTCPVAGPHSFVDSFGWPRPGGRTHQGIDLIASAGTPVVAVAPGTARPAGSIGGLGVTVQHPNGDWTFYAHLGSYGTLGSVSTGTVLGTIGSQDVSVPHLHFEYHPNGGAAVNPYSMLLAVC
jgi:murein DD-endopeptidase MepM/ murein hydrolase activator NlpD